MYQVKIEKHWSNKTYNVSLIHWQGDEGISFGKAFDVSKTQAEKEARHQADLYNATIIKA